MVKKNDPNMTELSSLTIAKVDHSNPLSVNAPADGSLVLGSLTKADRDKLTNNENYIPGVEVELGGRGDNYRVKDGTIFYNRETRNINIAVGGEFKTFPALEAVGPDRGVRSSKKDSKSSTSEFVDGAVIILRNKDGVLAYEESETEIKEKDPTTRAGYEIHKRRREKSKSLGKDIVVDESCISDIGYIDFSNPDPTTESEGFVYVDDLQTVAYQQNTTGTGENEYTNSCVVVGDGTPGTSTSSVNAVLEVSTTRGGLLLPRLSGADINDLPITDADKGLLVYNTDTNTLNFCDNSNATKTTVGTNTFFNRFVSVGSQKGMQTFIVTTKPDGTLAPSTTGWQPPLGVRSLKVTLVGAGGGASARGCGGGAGATTIGIINDITPDMTFTIDVGVAGISGTGTTASTAGSPSSFASSTGINVYANGGNFSADLDPRTIGAGGVASIIDGITTFSMNGAPGGGVLQMDDFTFSVGGAGGVSSLGGGAGNFYDWDRAEAGPSLAAAPVANSGCGASGNAHANGNDPTPGGGPAAHGIVIVEW